MSDDPTTSTPQAGPGWYSCLWAGYRHVFWWSDGRLWSSPDDQRPLFPDDRCTDFIGPLVPADSLRAEVERLRGELQDSISALIPCAYDSGRLSSTTGVSDTIQARATENADRADAIIRAYECRAAVAKGATANGT